MKLNVDKEADALYLRLDDSPIVESEEVSPGVVLDYNESNEVVGVEMLHLSKRSSRMNLSGAAIRDGIAESKQPYTPSIMSNPSSRFLATSLRMRGLSLLT